MDIGNETDRPGGPGWAVTALAFAMLLSSMGISIANVALPALAAAFDAPFRDVQWVVLAYLLAVTTMVVGAGRLGDVIGHRRVLLGGLAVFALGSLVCSVVPALPALVAARALQGSGAAALMAVTVALVRETVAKERTGSAMGLLGTTSAIGTALGPSLGGALIAGVGWHAIFYVLAVLSLPAFALAHRFLPAPHAAEGNEQSRPSFDARGTVLLALVLGAYALSMTLGDGFGTANAILLAAAGLGVALFVRVEAHQAAPLIDLRAFRDPALDASLAMNALVAAVMMATLVVGPFYLSLGLGIGAASVGLVMSIGPVISTLTGVPAGRLVDRFGASSVAVAGLLALSAGSLGLAVLPKMIGLPGYVLAIALLTPGYQLFQAANNTMVMLDVADERRGVISGLLSLSRNLGLVTGASAMGAVFAMAAGSSDMETAGRDAVAAGMQATFATAAGMMGLALVIGFGGRAFGIGGGRTLPK
jgi:MFS family permease